VILELVPEEIEHAASRSLAESREREPASEIPHRFRVAASTVYTTRPGVFSGLDFRPLRRERKHPCAANHATTTTPLDPW
jgi:hypothetical protein